jgi:hypothetical protein
MMVEEGWLKLGDRTHRWTQLAAEGPTSMKEKNGSTCRMRNAGLVRCGRFLLLALVWPSGLYLLLSRVEPLSGLLLLLAGIWLLLDNPLEFLAALSGPCPACGAEVRMEGRSPCRCPSCGRAIEVEEGRLFLATSEHGPGEGGPEDSADSGKDSSVAAPLPFAPGDTLDLHTFSPREVTPLVDDFLDLCEQTGISGARIIHGKGMGVLRARVRALLARDPRVLSYQDAPAEAGGWGATVVELRPGAKGDAREPGEE